LFDQAVTLNETGNYKEAFPVMKTVAEAGNVPAMSLLGSMHLMGRGVPENGSEAERWQACCGCGYLDAAAVLGMAYATGKAGIKRNGRLAKQLLIRASFFGCSEGRTDARGDRKATGHVPQAELILPAARSGPTGKQKVHHCEQSSTVGLIV